MQQLIFIVNWIKKCLWGLVKHASNGISRDDKLIWLNELINPSMDIQYAGLI